MSGSFIFGFDQSPSNQTLWGAERSAAPTELFTKPVIVSISVSERTPRRTAPATAPPLSSFTSRAAAISASIVAGTWPSRYSFT